MKLCGSSTESNGLNSKGRGLAVRWVGEPSTRLVQGVPPMPPCRVDCENSPEVEWGIIIPEPRTEEALRPTGRADEEVSRFSVAPRGKTGEVGREVLGWWGPPARDVIGPAGDPRVGEVM